MIELRQSTASQEIPLGYFLDSTDGNTEETGLTIANTDIKIWKNGATSLANKNSGGATHMSNGVYYAVLDATDTDTLGPMVIYVHVSGALTVRLECAVLTANGWDSKFSTDNLQVDVVQVGGDTQSATDLKDFADAGYDPATNKVQGVVLTDTCTTLTGHTPQTADHTAGIADIPTVAEFNARSLPSADYVVTSDTIAGVTLVDTVTDVTNEVTADVTKISGDTTAANNLELDYDGTGYAKANSTIGTCTTNTDMRGTDGANATVPDAAGTAPTAAEIRTEMDSNSTQLAAIVEDTGTTLDTKINNIQGATFSSATDSLEAIRNRGDAAWTTGAGGDATEAKQDSIIAAVITNAAGADIAADIIAVKSETASILEDTGTTIPGTIATVQSDLDTITGADGVTLATAQGNYAPAVAGDDMNLASTGLDSVVMSDLAAVPGATASIKAAVNWIFELCRNKVVTNKTNSEIEVYKDNTSTKFAEADISDDGTLFTRGEFGAVD